MRPWGGELPTSDAGGRILCIGDVHGCAAELEVLLRHVDAEATDRIVFLGDYVDRGPESRDCVRIVLEMKRSFPGTVALRGNHEEMFLGYLGLGGAHGRAFLSNGGAQTMRSFGLRGPLGHNDAAAEEAVREEIEFLRDSLVLSFAEGGAIFVHAGLRPGVPIAAQVPDDLLWIREEFLDADPGLPWLVVFGHTPYRHG
ncbi:MAG: metallophosphoesterase family protein, partial [Alphaproteobacteria bacterium]